MSLVRLLVHCEILLFVTLFRLAMLLMRHSVWLEFSFRKCIDVNKWISLQFLFLDRYGKKSIHPTNVNCFELHLAVFQKPERYHFACTAFPNQMNYGLYIHSTIANHIVTTFQWIDAMQNAISGIHISKWNHKIQFLVVFFLRPDCEHSRFFGCQQTEWRCKKIRPNIVQLELHSKSFISAFFVWLLCLDFLKYL